MSISTFNCKDDLTATSESSERDEFQAEVSRVMDITINSLYTDKQVFLNEIIQNADEDGIDPTGMYHSYLDLQLECIDVYGRRQIDHIFGDCSNTSRTNIYAADTSGEAIQFDGFCASSYSSKLDSLCFSVKPRDDTRTDCTYARWRTSATTGCDNGDVVSYCVSSCLRLRLHPHLPRHQLRVRQVCVFGG